jgi:hypothetical protein
MPAPRAPDYTLCALSSLSMSYNPHHLLPLQPTSSGQLTMFFLLEGLLAKAALPVNSVRPAGACGRAASKLNFGTDGSTTDISRQWLEEMRNTDRRHSL